MKESTTTSNYFLDIPATGQMIAIGIKADAWRQFRSAMSECCLYKGDTLLAEKYFMEVDEGFILETVIEKREKEEVYA